MVAEQPKERRRRRPNPSSPDKAGDAQQQPVPQNNYNPTPQAQSPQYPGYQQPGFQPPAHYANPEAAEKAQRAALTSRTTTNSTLPDVAKEDLEDAAKAHQEPAEEDVPIEQPHVLGGAPLNMVPTARSDLERAFTKEDLEKLSTTRSRMDRVGTRATLGFMNVYFGIRLSS